MIVVDKEEKLKEELAKRDEIIAKKDEEIKELKKQNNILIMIVNKNQTNS